MKKTVCILSLSVIRQDARVLRQIDYLSRHYHVHVIGYGPAPAKDKDLPKATWHELPAEPFGLPLGLNRTITRLIFAPFFPRLHPAYQKAVSLKCTAYHANNWDTLSFAALAAKRNGSKLVVDIHESYDSFFWFRGERIKSIAKHVFRKYSKQVDASTTVVKQLVEQHKQFGLDPIIVMNAPDKVYIKLTSRETKSNKIRLIHHGGASPMRSSDLMIKAVALCDPRYELHFMFVNDDLQYVDSLRTLAKKLAPGRIKFHRPVAPNKIVHEIAQYDAGFYPLPPKNFNHLIALPNKLFEFIAAGLAVCIGPSPSMAEIVKQYQCGVVTTSFEAKDIAKTLNSTTADQWNKMREASSKAANILNAEKELSKVLDVYRRLLRD